MDNFLQTVYQESTSHRPSTLFIYMKYSTLFISLHKLGLSCFVFVLCLFIYSYIVGVAEGAKYSPELIQLLELHAQFATITPYTQVSSMCVYSIKG